MNLRLSKIAIVAGDPELAEEICAHFRTPRVYVVLVGAPEVRLEEYGVFENDCITIANAIKEQRPQIVLFASCSPKVADRIRAHLPSVDAVDVQRFDAEKFRGFPGFRKHSFDVEMAYLRPTRRRHIVAVEKDDPMSLVIARNLAAASSADVFLLPQVADDQTKVVRERLRTWANESGLAKDEARRDVLGFIDAQLGPLPNAEPQSVSFITSGVPYGMYPFSCPTTHLVRYPLLGVSALNGMVKSLNRARRSPAVVLIDPGAVEKSELASLKHAFGNAGYLLRNAIGKNATAGHARDLTELMPSDFIFYSTHCGEVSGRRITERFEDGRGDTHVITYDLVRNLALSATPGMIDVLNFFSFRSLDGVDWTDEEGKSRIKAGDILRDFIEFDRRRDGDPKQYSIISSVESPPIKSSDSLQMHDFAYCPMPQVVGGYMHPVVFNNACSSWRELASRYGCHGAAAYIGTSLDVLDSLARAVATGFAREAAIGKPLGYALFRAQKQFVQQLGYTPYLMHGYLFTTVRPLGRSDPPPALLIAKRILDSLANYEEDWGGDAKAQSQLEATKAFLRGELRSLREIRSTSGPG